MFFLLLSKGRTSSLLQKKLKEKKEKRKKKIALKDKKELQYLRPAYTALRPQVRTQARPLRTPPPLLRSFVKQKNYSISACVKVMI
jgi:hypothetical protein